MKFFICILICSLFIFIYAQNVQIVSTYSDSQCMNIVSYQQSNLTICTPQSCISNGFTYSKTTCNIAAPVMTVKYIQNSFAKSDSTCSQNVTSTTYYSAGCLYTGLSVYGQYQCVGNNVTGLIYSSSTCALQSYSFSTFLGTVGQCVPSSPGINYASKITLCISSNAMLYTLNSLYIFTLGFIVFWIV